MAMSRSVLRFMMMIERKGLLVDGRKSVAFQLAQLSVPNQEWEVDATVI